MSLPETINFFESLAQRLQHGGLLADQANDIGVRMLPHVDALKQAQAAGAQIIDVTPTSREVAPQGAFRPPAGPESWGTAPAVQEQQPPQNRWPQG